MQDTDRKVKAQASGLRSPHYRAGLLGLLIWGLSFEAPLSAQGTDASGVPESQLQKDKKTERILGIVEKLKSALLDASDPAAQLIRIGLLYLRLEEADSAAAAFHKALERNPNLALAHTGLGRVQLELKDDPRKALSHFRAAVAADSTDAAAHTLLIRAYLKAGQTGARARRAADRLIRLYPKQAPAYLLLARVYQQEDNTRAATIFYKKYLEQQPDDQNAAYEFALSLLKDEAFQTVEEIASRMTDVRGLPLLSQALIHRRDHEGALEAFQRYIATLSPEEQNLYDDISLVGLPRETRAYRSTTPEAREAFLRNFWLRKDPFKTSGGAMRRAEHYRRVWHARTFFGQKTQAWDKRGEVYIRYGEPDYRSSSRSLNAQIPLAAQRVQETMAHQLYGDGGVHETFVGPVFPIRTQKERGGGSERPGMGGEPLGLSGWKPVTSGSSWSAVRWESWIYVNVGKGLEVAFTDEFLSGNYDYAPIPVLDEEDIQRYEARGERSYLHLVQRLTEFSPASRVANLASVEPETYPLTALEPLDFYYETLTFRGQNGKTDLQINLALPIDNVALLGDPDTVVIVERRTALIHGFSREIQKTKHDLVLPLRDRERERGLQAVNRLDQQVEPGDYELAVQAWRRNTDKVGVYRQTITIPDYTADRLMLSDIQIAHRVTEATETSDPKFVRGRWSIHPSPSFTFLPGTPLFVYFEIYNLSRDTFGSTRYELSYEVQMKSTDGVSSIPLLARLRKKDGETIGVRFEQIGTEPSVSDYLELDLAQAKPGQYTLHLNIKDLNNGQTDSRQSTFKIPRLPGR